jgi:Asp/Glu/hydantoin racemase
MPRVLVINPNSLERVTRDIDAAMAPLRQMQGFTVDVIGLPKGPPGIQSQQDVDGVVAPLLARLRTEKADAYVIACFSDPGLHAAREITGAPVFGIAESGILAALGRGSRFGIIAILQTSLARHLRYVAAMGVLDRLAGDRAIGRGVADLADAENTYTRMLATGTALRDQDGADVLVLGCAGMAGFRKRLAHDLGIPVIEPTQAAVAAAVGAVTLGW